MKSNNAGKIEIRISFVLFIIFLALKLTGVITWSWMWVFAPLWIPIAVVVAVMIATIIILSAGCLIKWLVERLV